MNRALGVLAFLAAAPAALAAQDQTANAIVGAEFRTVTFGNGYRTKSVSQLAVPIGITIPAGRRLTFDAGTYFVSARREDAAGAEATISGLTDLLLRGAFQIKPDVALFTVAVSVPTGQGSLDVAQDSVAREMSTDLLPFQVANFGTGLNVTTGLAFALPVGPWALGLAGSYRYAGSYEPFAGNATSLKPASEMRLRLGADRIVGQGRVSFGLTYSTFSNDEFGSNARSPGTRIIPQLSWSVPMGNNNLSFYAWDIYRNANEDPADSTIANQNTITVGAIYSLRMGRNVLRPQVEFRNAWAGPGGLHSNGKLFGVGLRYQANAGQRLAIIPGVRFDTGSRPVGATSYSFTGFSGSLTIRTNL